MSRILRLSPELANQIAAGEVVERPASVVKELVENAIDAGAGRVVVMIELGGKQLVRVEDDGEGMEPEDARLALERHATSKLASATDLAAIRTLGFRGEALPSIASVSRLRLRTRARGTTSGIELRVEAGVAAGESIVGAPEGTLVEVRDLFFNLPARRKFLKSDAAEAAQVSRTVGQLALAYPEIGFTLTSAGRTIVQCPPAASLGARFFQLYGERSDLVEIARDAGTVRVFGFVAALAEQGPVRGPQNVFVNRRIVRDRTIAHAIVQAYSVGTIKERSPEVHLFLEVAPDRIDVNVHPTKAEVRFLDQSFVHEVLRHAIMDALGQGPAPELQFRLAAPVQAPGVERPPVLPGVAAVGAAHPVSAGPVPGGPAPPGPALAAGQSGVLPMVPLGQFRDTFIIAIDDDGVAIVDQHVAHERVLFEQVLERLASGRLESQRLLEPMLVELGPAERQVLVDHADDLARLGFELDDFGGGAVRVRAVPALLGPAAAAAAVRALAGDLDGLEKGAGAAGPLRRLAATTACHAAVKANQPLTREKMQHILDELRRTAYSTVCPHGRPVVLRLTRREIEKNFQRI
jgi:DNA mismatch repair protein MutL